MPKQSPSAIYPPLRLDTPSTNRDRRLKFPYALILSLAVTVFGIRDAGHLFHLTVRNGIVRCFHHLSPFIVVLD